MKELLKLPEEFEIHKKGFSKKTFLNKAELTKNEKECIAKFVKSMQLIYDIRFHDESEIILMDVELLYKLNKSTDIDVARAISTAIPYNCITLIKNGKYVRIVVFSKQRNTIQPCRSVLCRQASTHIFDINYPFHTEREIISELTTQLCNISSTANDVIDMCVDIIWKNKNESKKVVKSKAEREILEEIKYGMDEGYDSAPERIMGNVYSYDEYEMDEDYDYGFASEGIMDRSYDSEEEHEILSKEEIFCDCAFTLYSESRSKINELDWLLQYAKYCENVLSDLYGAYNAKSDFYRKLGAAFREEKVVHPEDYLYGTELDLLDLLREMLNEE